MSDQAQAVVNDLPEVEELDQPQVDIEDAIEATEAEAPADVEQEDVAPEFAEVEIDGVTYQVPPELKDGYMMQADYTRKTQSLSGERDEFVKTQDEVKTQQEQLNHATKAVQQNLHQYAVLSNLDSQLQQYSEVDWNSLNASDPDTARQHQFHYMQLRDQRTQIYTDIQSREQQALQAQQTNIAKHVEQSRAVLSKEIEGFTPELERSLVEHAIASGADKRVAQNIIADPVATKLLHKAYLFDQLQVKAANAKKPKADVKPIKTVKGARTSTKTVYDNNLTTEQRIAMFRKGK